MAEPRQDTFAETQRRHVAQCIKEARFVAVTWLAALVFCGGWIGLFGYLPEAERPLEPVLIMGIPSWVIWGLFLPWSILVVVTWYFAAVILKDDEPLILPPADDEAISGIESRRTVP